eukprot:5199502-Prymnesium_polylepis.1
MRWPCSVGSANWAQRSGVAAYTTTTPAKMSSDTIATTDVNDSEEMSRSSVSGMTIAVATRVQTARSPPMTLVSESVATI